jgi:endonuclease YncB( thermonuclease family)
MNQTMRTRAYATRRFFTSIAAVLMMTPAFFVYAHPGNLDRKGCHYEKEAGKRHCHPDRVASSHVVAPPGPPRAGDEGVFDGPLMWVTDGDTLRVRVRGREMEVRLADVDAPERDQPHGWESKLQLIDLVKGQHLILAPRDVDHYGRVVAHVWVGDVDINRELVERGAAWFYAEYAEDNALYTVEQDARKAKAGLWALALEQRLEPWEWRRRQRESPDRSPSKGRE